MKPTRHEQLWWAIHNILAHPAMEILYQLWMQNYGGRLHNWTIPSNRPEMIEDLDWERVGMEKFWWPIHNLFAHPAMEIMYWLWMEEPGNRLHNWTIPKRPERGEE